MNRSDERMIWLLRLMAQPHRYGTILAWDEDVVDEFVKTFPEAMKSLRIYTLGPNSSPMLNRAAARARDRGYILPTSVGNMDARSYGQRTWTRSWELTHSGNEFLREEGRRAS